MITSINLSPIPFQANTDSTRLQMSSKQIQQSLPSLNCEIPYVIGNNFEHLTNNSINGIFKAKNDGYVVYTNDEIIILYYEHNETEHRHVPPIKKSYANFASRLRFKLKTGDKFQKDDIIYEYDCFRCGIPCPGYNIFTAYMPWFGYNHEDGLVISESFANKAKLTLIDKIYVPIYKFSLLKPIYINDANSFVFFPGVDQKLANDDMLCVNLIPKQIDKYKSIQEVKYDLIAELNKLNLSQFISMNNLHIKSIFNMDNIRSKLSHPKVHGIKIHRLKNEELINKDLNNEMKKMYGLYSRYLTDTYNDLFQKVNGQYAKNILAKYFVYYDKDLDRGKLDLRDVVYLLEFELIQDDVSKLGDKFTNMYAGKGVVSQILPDELRPVSEYSKKPIDLIFNPFGVYSRMNYGQIINGMVSKSIAKYDENIRENPNKIKEYISELNEKIIYYLDENYYNDVRKLIINNLDNDEFKDNFLKNILDNNLFIRAKAFKKLNIKQLSSNLEPTNESIKISKKCLYYIKDKLKIDLNFTINDDIICKNIFVAPIYTMKLYKLTSKTINARDFGPVESLTGQPTKGRAKQGGSKLGQMEIETIIAHGCERALKEFMTIKSDHNQEKKNMMEEIVTKGDYVMNFDSTSTGKTKKIVDVLINFLKE